MGEGEGGGEDRQDLVSAKNKCLMQIHFHFFEMKHAIVPHPIPLPSGERGG